MDASTQGNQPDFVSLLAQMQRNYQGQPAPLNLLQNAEKLWQIHKEITKSSTYFKADLLELLYASAMEQRTFISKDDDEGKKRDVLSHIPDNLMHCPVDGCNTEVDMLPQVVDLDRPPKNWCDVHKRKLEWSHWNPPCSDIGFKQVSGQILGASSSNTIGLGYFPDDYPVTTFALNYSEDVMRSIYNNEDGDAIGQEGWVHNKYVFTDEGFWRTLQETIIVNIQVSIYKSQGKAVDKMLSNWSVNQNSPLDMGISGRQKKPGAFDAVKRWMSG